MIHDDAQHGAQFAYAKISEVVDMLATHPGDIRKRLAACYFTLSDAFAVPLPHHIRAEMDWVRAQLNRFPSRFGEGTLKATLRRIRNSSGVKIASRILLLRSLLEAHLAADSTR